MIAIHEASIDSNKQAGRRILFEYSRRHDDGDLSDLWDDAAKDDRDRVNDALAAFDVVGFYNGQRWISRKPLFLLWERVLTVIRDPAEEYMAQRQAQDWHARDQDEQDRDAIDLVLWPHLRDLFIEVEARQHIVKIRCQNGRWAARWAAFRYRIERRCGTNSSCGTMKGFSTTDARSRLDCSIDKRAEVIKNLIDNMSGTNLGGIDTRRGWLEETIE